MLLYRLGPEGFFAASDGAGRVRVLHADPFAEPPSAWRLGRPVDMVGAALLAPVLPGKIIGVGRNYAAHAQELGNPVPTEPLLFLKAPSSVVGPNATIVLPPESERVEHEGEIAVVVRGTLRRADRAQAQAAVLGVTGACDVTARDLQRRDATFARAKSFDTFCPLGPAMCIEPDLDALEVITRINGSERQQGQTSQMCTSIVDLLVYISHMMTLDPGDVVLTGTPEGVGPLRDGDHVEVEVSGCGVLENKVEAWQGR